MSSSKLVVLLKAPRPGIVKTRLAKSIGTDAATAAYQKMVNQLLNGLSELSDVDLCYAPSDAQSEISPWLRPGWNSAPQAPGDLGKRIAAAFNAAFDSGAEKVVVIGSDCPAVTAEDIQRAWDALKTHDVVFGPATDGGYWLIGLRRPQVDLFQDMPWSKPTVFEESMRRAQQMGMSTRLLRQLSDIDTEQDWQAYQEQSSPAP